MRLNRLRLDSARMLRTAGILSSRVVAVLVVVATAHTDARSASSPLLARADSSFAAQDLDAARRAYAAVLEVDPQQSRALYQLARLTPERLEAERLLRRYVALEPEDAWGFMALGDLLGRAGRYDEANECYDLAVRLEPAEREAVVGRARWLGRAGNTDAAIESYEKWIAAHPEDAESWDELGRERRKAGRVHAAATAFERAVEGGDPKAEARLDAVRREIAPAVEPFVSGSWDSDGNGLLRTGISFDVALPGRTRVGVRAGRVRVEDTLGMQSIDELKIETTWRPLAVLRVQVSPGVARLPSVHPRAGDDWLPTLQARATWRASRSPAAVDLRLARELLAASPLLVESRVLRTEARAGAELPVVGGLRLRGSGRFASLESRSDTNARRAFQGGLVLSVLSQLELCAQALDLRYDHPSWDGYFAPRVAQLAEGGIYLELESVGPMFLAIDAGAGLQRIAAFDGPPGPWGPAFRVWAQLGLALGRGCRLNLEFEGYDSQSGVEATTATGWRYGFAAASLRVPMP